MDSEICFDAVRAKGIVSVKESEYWTLRPNSGFKIEVEEGDEDADWADDEDEDSGAAPSLGVYTISLRMFEGDKDDFLDAEGKNVVSYAAVFEGRQVNRKTFVDGLYARFGREPDGDEVDEEMAFQIIVAESEIELVPDLDPDSNGWARVHFTYKPVSGGPVKLTGYVHGDEEIVVLERQPDAPTPPQLAYELAGQLLLFGRRGT